MDTPLPAAGWFINDKGVLHVAGKVQVFPLKKMLLFVHRPSPYP
jgi:hypothetical protein